MRTNLGRWMEENMREVPRPGNMTPEAHQREDAMWEDLAEGARKAAKIDEDWSKKS